jgi:hypothetical protein
VTFDKEKFKRLVHYVAWKAGKKAGFGATKLNKVLWFADARAYVLTGKPITGATYIRQKYGPVPREMMPAQAELVREGKIKIIRGPGRYDHTQFLALEPPDSSALSAKEHETVDYWIRHIDEDHTAASISEQSHDYPWEIAKMGEEIPLHACFATRVRDPVGDELEWAKKVAEKLKLP